MKRAMIKRPAAGFTLIEAMVALAIFGILMAVGVPRMTEWLSATRAGSAAGFYAEGYAMARTQALSNNSQSRLVFTAVPNGQPDWQVDICVNTTDTPCTTDGNWSSTTGGAAGATGAAAGYRSIRRSGASLPPANLLIVTLGPDSGSSVYFTPVGWVDTSRNPRVTRIDLAPHASRAGAFRASRVALTLAGVATTCDPSAAAGDSRRCPE